MNGCVQDFVRDCVEKYPELQGDILEIGSRDICGSAKRWFTLNEDQKTPTSRFPKYIGIDIVEGNLVDRVMSSHDLDFAPGEAEFDIVVCVNMLEHDDDPFLTMCEIDRVLKPGGWLILAVPGWKGCGVHCEPDYWRFMPDGVKRLFELAHVEMLEFREIETENDLMAIGRKSDDVDW